MPRGEYVMNTTNLPTTMRAAVLHGPHEMSIESVPVPQLAANEVLVEVEANGLCGSDVHCYTGERVLEYPMVLGHEIVGHIVATGANVSPGRLGERVSVEPNFGCGECALCARGLERICLRKQTIGITRWGGLAEYVAVPHDYAWSIPETFALRDAATIEPTTLGGHAFSRAQPAPGATIAVIGRDMEDVTLNPFGFVRQDLETRGTLINEHPTDYPVPIAPIATGKLAPGATASEPQPLESAASLLEAMAAGTLNAKPIVSPR